MARTARGSTAREDEGLEELVALLDGGPVRLPEGFAMHIVRAMDDDV